MTYSARVLEYFLDPKHAYRMEQPDGIGVVGDLSCGDFFVMYIRVRGERLTEVSYQIFGCPAAIATCEAAAQMATGKSLEEAERITDDSVAEFLGGLPEMKLHCSNSAADALRCAIADYRAEGQGKEDHKTTEVIEDATR
jgi:nitrogen fixation NifU-like protein